MRNPWLHGRPAVVPYSNSRLRRFTCLALTCMVLTIGVTTAHAVDPHPAQTLIDRAAAGVRNDPDASSRDAQAALEILARQPDTDLEIRARLLLCDHLSE